jgi:hypothetical protein
VRPFSACTTITPRATPPTPDVPASRADNPPGSWGRLLVRVGGAQAGRAVRPAGGGGRPALAAALACAYWPPTNRAAAPPVVGTVAVW